MAVWPTAFCALVNSFTETPPENVLRSSMDKGPAKVRRRTTANVRPISFKMALTGPQTQQLDDFYITETVSGADEFDFIHPRTKQNVKARFVNPPQYNERGGKLWEVSVSLEILP